MFCVSKQTTNNQSWQIPIHWRGARRAGWLMNDSTLAIIRSPLRLSVFARDFLQAYFAAAMSATALKY